MEPLFEQQDWQLPPLGSDQILALRAVGWLFVSLHPLKVGVDSSDF